MRTPPLAIMADSSAAGRLDVPPVSGTGRRAGDRIVTLDYFRGWLGFP